MTRQDKMIYLTQLSFTRHIGYRYTFTIQTETPDTQDVKYYALLMLQIEADRLTGRQSCETMTPDQAELDFRRNNPDLILVLILRLKFLLKRWYISLLIKVKKKKNKKPTNYFLNAGRRKVKSCLREYAHFSDRRKCSLRIRQIANKRKWLRLLKRTFKVFICL